MDSLKLILKSILYYRRQHFNAFLGIAISTAILVGALGIGDSVKISLQNMIQARLGKTQFAIVTRDKLFPSDLADRLSVRTGIQCVPILQIRGIAASPNTGVRVNRVQVIGIDSNFWNFAPVSMLIGSLNENEAIINQKLATFLNLKQGDEMVLRIEKLSMVSSEAPLVPDDRTSIPLRVKIKIIARDDQLGNFGVQNSQIIPYNVFLSLPYLSKKFSSKSEANLILCGESKTSSLKNLHNALTQILTLPDINLEIRSSPAFTGAELVSSSVFITDTLKNEVSRSFPLYRPVLTYFVNSIQYKDKSCPYTFVSAPGNEITNNLKVDEIILNQWTADDLHVKIGEIVEICYFILGPYRNIKEEKISFTVKTIVPLSGWAADSTLMPAFEGLAKVENCHDWEAGIPIDLSKIRPKDEKYWEIYRGTPKAFISYERATTMWKNKFGSCTAIRFPDITNKDSLSSALRGLISPSEAGFILVDVKSQSLLSSSNSVDFSQLFVCLSIVLLVSSILLTALLFSLQVDKRIKEMGIFYALGIKKRKVMQFMMTEGAIIAISGVVAGCLLGLIVNQAILGLLNTLWNDAVRTSSIFMHISFQSIATGALINLLVAFLVIYIVVRRKAQNTIHELQKKNENMPDGWLADFRWYFSFTLLCFAASIIIFASILISSVFQDTLLFFTLGFLNLAGMISLIYAFLLKKFTFHHNPLGWVHLAIRNMAYNRYQSISIAGLLSISAFLVFSTGLNRVASYSNASEKTSGTGGYDYFAETTLPFIDNLNKQEGLQKFGIENLEGKVKFVQFRTLPGDDASCLNLNRAIQPQLISVESRIFSDDSAFSFIKTDPKIGIRNPWSALDDITGDGTIYGIADQTVITWGLGRKLGDTLLYRNETGDTLKIKLMAGLSNSVFQGNILISESNFIKNYPGISGSRIFLASIPDKNENKEQIIKQLTDAFQNYGIHIDSAAERLEMFDSVTNTYLDIFLSLGGFGLLLGTFGIAVIVTRRLMDQKRELAMLSALGIKHRKLSIFIFAEYSFLMVVGLLCGLFSALIAAFPSLSQSKMGFPVLFLIVFSAVFLLNGMIWIWFIARKNLNQKILESLRNE